jgi:hypothetical protein
VPAAARIRPSARPHVEQGSSRRLARKQPARSGRSLACDEAGSTISRGVVDASFWFTGMSSGRE